MAGISQDLAARSPDDLMEIVGAIYDTVLDRTIWPEVLKKISLFIPGAASAVFWEDASSNQGDVYFYDDGIPPVIREPLAKRVVTV
jgi:hypothetical protein